MINENSKYKYISWGLNTIKKTPYAKEIISEQSGSNIISFYDLVDLTLILLKAFSETKTKSKDHKYPLTGQAMLTCWQHLLPPDLGEES